MNGIRLSQKNGVNPCIAECYICGETKNEIYLTGAAGDRIAQKMGQAGGDMPMQAIFDVEPCDKCKEKGIALIEMTHQGEGAQPTGRRCLLKEKLIQEMITPPELVEHILRTRAAFLGPEAYSALGLGNISKQ